MRKYSKKALESRKTERACLPEFFQRHIEIARNSSCEECGSRLTGHISEIAHILPKQYFKSIMCNDLNVLYLCGMYSEKQCHTNFDTFSQEKIKQMNIYPKIQAAFIKLQEEITEKLNYKHYNLYE